MNIDKDFASLVLYRYPLVDSMSVLHNNAKVLDERKRLHELGYLRVYDYSQEMRYSDTGNERMLNTYLENKDPMITFLEKCNGKFTEEMFRDELNERDIEYCDFWISFLLEKLKADKIITQFDLRDNDTYICYYN